MRGCWTVLVMLAASGCGAITGGDNTAVLASRYDLATYNGGPLPVTTRRIVSISPTPGDTTGFSCDDRITGQQLLVGPSDQVRQVTQRAWVCDKTQHNQVSADTLGGRVTISGTDVNIAFSGSNVVPSIAHGHVVGSELRVDLVESGSPQTSFDPTLRVFRPAP
jgi:hypothetical protein